ncbi:uncharacterized protein EURHEDRAFT_489984 [Aspergillus ruber CBS 135680]|uniref:Deoxyribonuclease NucA/NucB domain-containing protein n=1 Tax=Aspergillus ruber (strain CBS 135680) TaxID=1388766 RepID=A0A017S197_ASPRC|nr:uncharacterized protein EURHEDRAFT_489984 [Aspergillus ruber CBS 135680]EYE89940.1 hypothetical protein EURHEDRAFT_489984 [Aspergillus ruber CBS 135680]
MKTSTVLFAFCSLAGIEKAIAAPVGELLTRATGTGNDDCDPIQGTLNIRGEDALTYDADCWAMLCGGKDPVMQKIASSYADKHRQVAAGSAASKQPFKNPSSNGIKALPPTTAWGLNQDWDSAEEFPFASTVRGGQGALLFPVNKKSQDEQKISLSAFYSSNRIKGYDPAKKGQAGAEDGTWFTIKKFTGPVGPYCKAYNDDDISVCHKKTADSRWDYDPAEYAYTYDHASKTFKHQGK